MDLSTESPAWRLGIQISLIVVQRWPLNENAPDAHCAAASATFASSNTIAQSFESICNRVRSRCGFGYAFMSAVADEERPINPR